MTFSGTTKHGYGTGIYSVSVYWQDNNGILRWKTIDDDLTERAADLLVALVGALRPACPEDIRGLCGKGWGSMLPNVHL